MDQTCDVFCMTGTRQIGRQGDVGLIELSFRAMQDGDEVDHHIMAMHQSLQLLGVMHIGLHHTHAGHHLNLARW